MYRSSSCPLVLLLAINFLLNGPANAGVVKRSIRMVREVYPPDVEPENDGNQPQVCIVGDVVYAAEEAVPAEQPCLKCKCQPPGVQCETQQCAKKPGCKAIHRSNKCCPDYQCECEHDGKIYANGEKLETNPGGECKVCYCRGGEVQCAEVSCYIRKDCEGKRVPGKCCPKYEHCPPIDLVLDRSPLTSDSPLNTLKPIILDLWQNSSLNTTEIPNDDTNKVPDTNDSATVPPTYFNEMPRKDEGMPPRITIQEIIPERKEIPITAPPRVYLANPPRPLIIEEALPTLDNTSNDLNGDNEPDSSEVSEVFQHPPPVLRIGDKLLFLKKGELVPEKDTSTPHSVITIIGAEGLQRGGVEDSLEVHEVKIEPKAELQNVSYQAEELESATSKPKTEVAFSSMEPKVEESETNDLELKASESTHILSLVKRKNKSGSTTTSTTTQLPTTSVEVASTLIEEEQQSFSTEITSTTPLNVDTTIQTTSKRSIESVTESQSKNADPSEQNPAYPPIPDIMPAVGDVSQKFEVELENDNSTTMEIKILPEVYDFLNNKTQNHTNNEWLKNQNDQKNLASFKAGILPDELLNQRSPIDEDEENSTEISGVTTQAYETKPTKKDKFVEEGAQLIAEVKISEVFVDPSTTTESVATTEASKLLSDEIKEFKENMEEYIGSLKENASLKSVESLEVDSGEQTTPKTNASAIMSSENASVEITDKGGYSETNDMVLSSSKETSVELGSVEITETSTKSVLADVEVFSTSTAKTSELSSTMNILKQDVESVPSINLPLPTKIGKVESSTYELLPTPEETKSKSITKRQIVTEDVFKDLEMELDPESSQTASKSPKQEQEEADKIFQELLVETTSSKSISNKPKNEEQQKIDSISSSLAGFVFKGKNPEANLFKVIGGLFGGQRK